MGLAFPKVKNSEFKPVGEGLYLATLKSVSDPEKKFSEKYGEQTQVRLIWLLEGVLDGEDENEEFIGEEIWEFCTWSMGKKAKLRARVEALLGRPLEETDELNDEAVLGKRVKLNIVHYTKENGDTGQKVASAVVYRRKKKASPAPMPRPVNEDDDEDEGDEGLPF